MLCERVEVALQHASSRWPDKLALVCREHRLSYAELSHRVDALAQVIADRGIGRGDKTVHGGES